MRCDCKVGGVEITPFILFYFICSLEVLVGALVLHSFLPGRLGALAADPAGQLDVLGHDGHALGVDGAQVGVLEEGDQVRLGRLLQSKDGRALKAQVILEIL